MSSNPNSPDALKAGTPLAKGFYGILWIVRGGLDEMAKGFKLAHAGSREPCSLCRANLDDVPWTEAHPTRSKWLGTVWDRAEWLETHPDRHAIFTLPGISVDAFVPDIMHCVHLGSYAYFSGQY